MAKGVNKAILIGHLGADPQVRYMPNGDAVANVNLATNETWKDRNTGQTMERTEWHRLVFYRGLAQVVGQYLKKGAQIYVEGRLRTRQWEKDGVKHYTTEVIVDDMQMLDRNPDGGAARPSPEENRRAASSPYDDEIPF